MGAATKGPLTRIASRSDLSPQGEVMGGTVLPQRTSPLGGEVDASASGEGAFAPCSEGTHQ